MTDTPYDRAIAYAAEIGREHGTNAASWVFDGNTSDETYARILAGLDDGDPEILDSLPAPDLSGQWADSLTGPRLIVDALDAAGHSRETVHASTYGYCRESEEWGADICDAYENAFSDAVSDAVETAARAHVAAVS
jgi:hypothetical protein